METSQNTETSKIGITVILKIWVSMIPNFRFSVGGVSVIRKNTKMTNRVLMCSRCGIGRDGYVCIPCSLSRCENCFEYDLEVTMFSSMIQGHGIIRVVTKCYNCRYEVVNHTYHDQYSSRSITQLEYEQLVKKYNESTL